MLTLLLLVVPAARAAPEDVACVGVERPDCTLTPETLEAALASSAHVVHLGRGPFEGTFASAAEVEIAGSEGSVVRGDLTLTGAFVALHNVRVEGRLALGPGMVRLDDADLGRVVLDHADLTGRGLTVTAGLETAGGSVALASSVVATEDPFSVSDGASVTTTYSAHAADADATATDRVAPPGDPRRVTGTVLADAGDPAPLAPFEPFEDAAGVPRIAGAGPRRDIGAYEAQPSPDPIPGASVLANGGAESGLAGWSGTFTAEPFGAPFLPSAATGIALGADRAFFSGAGEAQPELFQRIDVTGAAGSIDRGLGRAALSGLVGGYGADADELSVRAVFKDPENTVVGALELPPVTAAERAADTTLLPRVDAGAIPARTRAIDVLLHAERRAGAYTDAYADNLGLVLSVPGVPADPPATPEDPPVADLKPFSGVSVLTPEPRFSRRGGARLLLACASETVGACRGSLELRALLPGTARAARIARYAVFRVRRGAARHVVVRLLSVVRGRLLRRRSLPATLIAISRDRQGLQRRTTVPVTLVFNPPARGARRRGSTRGSAGSDGARAPRRAAGRSAA